MENEKPWIPSTEEAKALADELFPGELRTQVGLMAMLHPDQPVLFGKSVAAFARRVAETAVAAYAEEVAREGVQAERRSELPNAMQFGNSRLSFELEQLPMAIGATLFRVLSRGGSYSVSIDVADHQAAAASLIRAAVGLLSLSGDLSQYTQAEIMSLSMELQSIVPSAEQQSAAINRASEAGCPHCGHHAWIPKSCPCHVTCTACGAVYLKPEEYAWNLRARVTSYDIATGVYEAEGSDGTRYKFTCSPFSPGWLVDHELSVPPKKIEGDRLLGLTFRDVVVDDQE